MPLEIRELIIKTRVEDGPQKSNVTPTDLKAIKEEVVQACMERMHELMADKNER